ncbi:MAG TPA: hypothetical protein GX718_03590 [Brevibacterium sp.]|nr:hypothetical protein [Brevibacterium sp.]
MTQPLKMDSMKTKWQNLSKGKKTWVIIGAVVILAAAAAPLRDDDPEPAEAQEPTASPVVDEEPSEEASEEPEAPAVDADEIMQTWLDAHGVEKPSDLYSDEHPNIWSSPLWAITDWENDDRSGMIIVYVQEHLDDDMAENIAVSIFMSGARETPELTHVRVIGLDGIDRYTSRSTALPYED